MEGFGHMTTKVYQYTGDWYDDKRNGEGHLVYINSAKSYQGAFYNSKMEGQGKMDFGKNKYYEGAWYENMFEGVGKYVSSEGVYEGEFYEH